MKESLSTSPVRFCDGNVPVSTDKSLPTLNLTPKPAFILKHYYEAMDGLYKGYLFGAILIKAQAEIFGSDTRVTTESISTGKGGITPDWRAGTGFKGWLEVNCPEIAYHTARRFLKLAENVHIALDKMGLELTEANIRAFLEGKSQRQLLKPAEPLLLDDSKRYARLRENVYDFVHGLEGVQSSGDSLLLTPEDRFDLVQRLKSLTRKLEGEAM